MTELEARQLVEARFAARWPIESADVPFMIDNERAVTGDRFASLSIRGTTGAGQLTTGPEGTRLFERRGAIYVRIWTPQGEGPAGGAALCDAARRVLEGRALTLPTGGHDLVIEAGDSQAPMLDRRWWMSTVVFRFRYYETR